MTLGSSLIILSASPTCFLSVISPLRKRERTAARRPRLMPGTADRPALLPLNANPWDPLLSLMTANCYCRGSEEEESRLR